MLVGLEVCSDRRVGIVRKKDFYSLAAALRWLREPMPEFAFPGAADPDLPMTQQNFHRNHRELYRVDKRLSQFRIDSKRFGELRAIRTHGIEVKDGQAT